MVWSVCVHACQCVFMSSQATATEQALQKIVARFDSSKRMTQDSGMELEPFRMIDMRERFLIGDRE